MAFTSADLDAINAAIARGERTVQFADRSVTYRSIDELLQARAVIAASLAARPRQRLAYASKGFDE